jgi:hypothetical protein
MLTEFAGSRLDADRVLVKAGIIHVIQLLMIVFGWDAICAPIRTGLDEGRSALCPLYQSHQDQAHSGVGNPQGTLG